MIMKWRWIVGKHQRTYQRLVKKHLKFLHPQGVDGDRKNKAKNCENCVNMPIRISRGNENKPLIHEHKFEEDEHEEEVTDLS